MFRFMDLIEGRDEVREICQRYPATGPMFERFGIRLACYECSISIAAQRAGVSTDELLAELNKTVFQRQVDTSE